MALAWLALGFALGALAMREPGPSRQGARPKAEPGWDPILDELE